MSEGGRFQIAIEVGEYRTQVRFSIADMSDTKSPSASFGHIFVFHRRDGPAMLNTWYDDNDKRHNLPKYFLYGNEYRHNLTKYFLYGYQYYDIDKYKTESILTKSEIQKIQKYAGR